MAEGAATAAPCGAGGRTAGARHVLRAGPRLTRGRPPGDGHRAAYPMDGRLTAAVSAGSALPPERHARPLPGRVAVGSNRPTLPRQGKVSRMKDAIPTTREELWIAGLTRLLAEQGRPVTPQEALARLRAAEIGVIADVMPGRLLKGSPPKTSKSCSRPPGRPPRTRRRRGPGRHPGGFTLGGPSRRRCPGPHEQA